MIPIKLSIKGLYSYQDVQEVDFQRLSGSSVFGIFGKVGSGKTSLLEAISFALYGKTERLNDQDKRAYNMMNLKSKHLLIDFEFQAGPDQQLYRFVYEAKRHPKKHHEISPGERRLFSWQGTDWHPMGNEKEDVSVLSKQILGLDYDNFKRTIIIPQNQFREFLELNPADRTKMMNQLFKLDQYDLAGRVGKLSKANDDQLAELRGLLSPLEGITPEAIDQANVDIIAITNTVRAKETEIEQLAPNERQLLHAQAQSLTLANVQRELAGLQTQETTYAQLRQTVSLYETCRLVFQGDLVTQRKLQDKHIALVTNRAKAAQQLSLVENQLPALQSVYDATKTAYESRNQLQQQIDELETVQQIRLLQESVELQIRNRQHIALRTDRQKSELGIYKTERIKHQTSIDSLLGKPMQLERLYQVEKWFAVYRPLKKQADELQNQLTDQEAIIAQIKQQKDQALVGFPEEWAVLTLKTLPGQIDDALEQLKAIRKDREKVYQQALVKQELGRFTNTLAEGVPCPLCGSQHHPSLHNAAENKPSADLINQEVLKSEGALNKVDQRIEDTTTLRLLIEGFVKQLRGALDNSRRLFQERTEIVQQLTEQEDQFSWPEFDKDREDDLTDTIRQESEQQKLLQEGQKALRDLNRQIENMETVQREEEKTLNGFDTAIAGLNGELKKAIESLSYYRLSEIERWDLSQITDLRDSLTRTYTQTKTNFEEAEKQKSSVEKLQATLKEQLQQLDNQLADLTFDIQAVEVTLAQNLISQAVTRQVVEQVLQSNLDIDQEKRRIKDYDHKRAGLQKQITDLASELNKLPFDPVELATVQSKLKALRHQKDELNREFGQLTNVLATLQQQWEQKQAHQKRYDALDLRRQDLKKMDELFRAQGFVNYVSSVYLKNLCESANERFFKLTNNQLKMELDEKNNFLVRDYLNGGEVRSIKTLSGGQTFQAALSMALALSDNIQHLTRAKQNLFFLDEGFGTLDKDSLQTVFKTLKALRSENRVVGIISHVEELQQEVDAYIRTEATENGSRIISSWDE